ncbi:glyoxalase [Nocardioides sp.]|uniref:glyoxalase n=1 Tax=Nocardioides sp. TaxID=35761 RepID=UPI003510F782
MSAAAEPGAVALHHVQVCCPRGGEDAARLFYGGALGLTEVPKPPALAGRGGVWFRSVRDGVVVAELHVGVEEPFVPAARAHPAFLLPDEAALRAVGERIEALGARLGERLGCRVSDDEWATFPGYRRLHAWDPHGNRVEILCPA